MKKIIFGLLIFVLISCVVFAVGQQTGQDSSQGEQIQETMNTQQKTQTMAKDSIELKQMIQQRQTEMNQEMVGFDKTNQKVYQNQNQVRLAVHALLAMENLTGGIGKNVSQIAKEFNNSIQATLRAEERIQKRSSFTRFFTGGDEKGAKEIEQEVNRNRERIEQLNQLKEKCSCDEEIKQMFQEQTQNMEQEQNRLLELAQTEKKSKGLFGWIWK